MSETVKKIERTPALAKLLVEARESLKAALEACKKPAPKEDDHGAAHARHA